MIVHGPGSIAVESKLTARAIMHPIADCVIPHPKPRLHRLSPKKSRRFLALVAGRDAFTLGSLGSGCGDSWGDGGGGGGETGGFGGRGGSNGDCGRCRCWVVVSWALVPSHNAHGTDALPSAVALRRPSYAQPLLTKHHGRCMSVEQLEAGQPRIGSLAVPHPGSARDHHASRHAQASSAWPALPTRAMLAEQVCVRQAPALQPSLAARLAGNFAILWEVALPSCIAATRLCSLLK